MPRNRWIAVVVLVVLVATAPPAAAQSAEAFFGWMGLTRTPVGALAPVPSTAASDGGGNLTFRLRSGFWSFGPGDDETTNLGLGVGYRRGVNEIRFDLARSTNAQCSSCAATLAGIDVVRPIRTIPFAGPQASSLIIALNPALGYAKDEQVTSMTFALSVPVELRLPISARWRLIPFVAPGFGFARLSVDTESENGHRAFIGAGAALGTTSGRFEANVGFRKVFLEGAPETVGVGVAWRPR